MAALLQKLWRFHGGVRPTEHKDVSLREPIRRMPLPSRVQVQLRQHLGAPNDLRVSVGQHVLKGEVLAIAQGDISSPVHAPTSGTVIEIGLMPVPHASGLPTRCVLIEPDGLDQWGPLEPHGDLRELDPQSIYKILHELGVVGLGGALFPTAVKLAQHDKPVDRLIINAAECEPYISCDQALMAERAIEIVEGIEIAAYALNCSRVLIGIEDNKSKAITALQSALHESKCDIELRIIPTVYPSGGERQLIKILTGREVPSCGLPADIGLRVINIATAYAIHQAIRLGQPVISRVVTVTGDGVNRPANVETLIGTPMAELINFCGGYCSNVRQLTMGGPMMGLSLANDDYPVVKSTNCLIASTELTQENPPPEQPCIRCGACEQVCPATLLPQQLYWYARARDLEKLQQYHIADCIECGACSYVCPSHIPLVQYYRYAKSEINEESRNRLESDLARERYEARQARLAAAQREKEARMAKKRAALEASKQEKQATAKKNDSKQDVIAAALARAKAKKAGLAKPKNTDNLTAAQRAQINAADSRRAALDGETDNGSNDRAV